MTHDHQDEMCYCSPPCQWPMIIKMCYCSPPCQWPMIIKMCYCSPPCRWRAIVLCIASDPWLSRREVQFSLALHFQVGLRSFLKKFHSLSIIAQVQTRCEDCMYILWRKQFIFWSAFFSHSWKIVIDFLYWRSLKIFMDLNFICATFPFLDPRFLTLQHLLPLTDPRRYVHG
jgi:hypothetical protein